MDYLWIPDFQVLVVLLSHFVILSVVWHCCYFSSSCSEICWVNLAWVLLLNNLPLLSTVSITVALGSYLIISFSTIFAMVSFLFKMSWYKFSISTFFSVIFSSIISLTLFKHLITTSVKIYPKLIFSLVHFL